ncbi:hypothetical protein [Bradyrhizobium sp. CIR18]|uniref:hypothetical protein n=1 Tax=Bradyrhizobium sp. CIR18 TaxID=2663839 RepID=UPI001FF0587A|nr:hypothetical protein [Bradyrhizobium sp. CIR18]
MVIELAAQTLRIVAAERVDHSGKTVGKGNEDGRCWNWLAVLPAQRGAVNASVGKTLRNMEIEGARIPVCGSFADMRPGGSMNLCDGLSVNDCLQEQSGFAIDPALEVQPAKPAQLACFAQIDEACAATLQIDGLTNDSAKIGEACLEDARGAKQIGLYRDRKAATRLKPWFRELGNEGVGIGRAEHQTVEQDLNGIAALRRVGVVGEAGQRPVVRELEPADELWSDRRFGLRAGEARHAHDPAIQSTTRSASPAAFTMAGIARSPLRGLSAPPDQSQ